MKIELTSTNVKSLGRTRLFGDTLLLSLSGSGIEFVYTGKGLTVSFVGGGASEVPDNEANYARIAIFVDGDSTIGNENDSVYVRLNKLSPDVREKISLWAACKASPPVYPVGNSGCRSPFQPIAFR